MSTDTCTTVVELFGVGIIVEYIETKLYPGEHRYGNQIVVEREVVSFKLEDQDDLPLLLQACLDYPCNYNHSLNDLLLLAIDEALLAEKREREESLAADKYDKF